MTDKLSGAGVTHYYLKRAKTVGQGFAIGILDTYCAMLRAGVRDIAMFSPFWPNVKHRRYEPMIQRIAGAYELNVLAHPAIQDSKNKKYWVYYIYRTGQKDKALKIINLFENLTGDKKKDRKAHRAIGRLFGYAPSEIKKIYG